MWIQAYYPKTRFASPTPGNLPFDRMTHLAIFSMAPDTVGGVVNTSGADLTATLSTIVGQCHLNNVKALITIGGSSAAPDSTWRSAISSTYRSAFVANILAFVNLYSLDGVDIDWEPFSSSSDVPDFKLFLAELRAALGPTKLITIFLVTTTTFKRTLANDIQDVVNRINLSTYDYSFSNALTVHDSPLYNSGSQPTGKSADEALALFTAAGCAIGKLNIAAPFYAQQWSGHTSLFEVATINAFTSVTYASLSGASATTEPTGSTYDSTAKAAYINGDPFTSVPSVQSIQDKVNYIKANGVGGIIIWELGQAYFSGATPHFPLMEPFANELSLEHAGSMTGISSLKGVSSIKL